jgi:predicted RNase H-like HicB family nuclease
MASTKAWSAPNVQIDPPITPILLIPRLYVTLTSRKEGAYFSSTPGLNQCMSLGLQLEYWKDGEWFLGRLAQVPGVFSQGATIEELEDNIRDAYRMMLEEQGAVPTQGIVQIKEIHIPA